MIKKTALPVIRRAVFFITCFKRYCQYTHHSQYANNFLNYFCFFVIIHVTKLEVIMIRKTLFALVIVGVVVALSIPVFSGEGWELYKADDYGFSMLVPKGATFQEKEYEDGWGALHADYQGVKLWAVGKLGASEQAKTIEKYGVKVTGIPDKYWKVIDKGKNSRGWKWYYTVKASDGKSTAYGGYGVGPKGSYLIVLVTSESDFEEHYNDYLKWYKSISLY
jgi:hypothetical protein